jgi:hypothetical protein
MHTPPHKARANTWYNADKGGFEARGSGFKPPMANDPAEPQSYLTYQYAAAEGLPHGFLTIAAHIQTEKGIRTSEPQCVQVAHGPDTIDLAARVEAVLPHLLKGRDLGDLSPGELDATVKQAVQVARRSYNDPSKPQTAQEALTAQPLITKSFALPELVNAAKDGISGLWFKTEDNLVVLDYRTADNLWHARLVHVDDATGELIPETIKNKHGKELLQGATLGEVIFKLDHYRPAITSLLTSDQEKFDQTIRVEAAKIDARKASAATPAYEIARTLENAARAGNTGWHADVKDGTLSRESTIQALTALVPAKQAPIPGFKVKIGVHA